MQRVSSTTDEATFTYEEIRTASPARRAWYQRVLDLMQQTGASLDLARQAVEDADRTQPTRES